MQRRHFIVLLCSGAAACPLATRAQQPGSYSLEKTLELKPTV